MMPSCIPRQHPKRFENQTGNRPPKWVNSNSNVTRLALPEHEPTRQFFRQVAYDHFSHFNYHYPGLRLTEYEIVIEAWTAQRAYEQIRTLGGGLVDWWSQQYALYAQQHTNYLIFREMSKNLTPPFPPVIIESKHLVDVAPWVYGQPYHLIEGTHRVSYLRYMLEQGIITPQSEHSFVVLRPKKAVSAKR